MLLYARIALYVFITEDIKVHFYPSYMVEINVSSQRCHQVNYYYITTFVDSSINILGESLLSEPELEPWTFSFTYKRANLKRFKTNTNTCLHNHRCQW